MAETAYGTSSQELDDIFGMDDEKRQKIAGIRNRVKMPDPDNSGSVLNVRVLYYKEADGQTQLFKKVTGEQFSSAAVFLNVEEVEQPGIEKDLGLSKTLHMSIDKELTNRGMSWEQLPGCVLSITADYWTSAPRNKRSNMCPKCSGKGCKFCTVTGTKEDSGQMTGLAPPVRYNAVIRDDMRNAGPSASGDSSPTEF